MDSNLGNNMDMAPQQEPQQFIPQEQDPKAQKVRLRKRFVSGILVGCMVSLFILAGIYVFWGFMYGFGSPFGIGAGSAADSGELLNDETLGKIEALEDVIDTYY